MTKGSYQVRTQFINADGLPTYTNNLIKEDSPYLLQHAHNPVNWYAWSDEAFARAKQENKPVFLSVGYSTCHWCHVMEEESFDNEAVAKILNEHFISIKVDREQRPDLDEIYLSAVQIFSGQGGWPISAFLTPDAKPFFAATYLPQNVMIIQLKQVYQRWQQEQPELEAMADEIHGYILEASRYQESAAKVNDGIFADILVRVLSYEDKIYGGISEAPKFPMAPLLWLIMNRLQSPDAEQQGGAIQFIHRTLNAMLQGGIYDQLGGGFHRYATDKAWRIPHFEKMLYDQAQLILVYSQAWLVFGDPEYRRITKETCDYLLRELRGENGCFFSATDADSEGVEGKYFVWSASEIEGIFDKADCNFIHSLYGIIKADKSRPVAENILYLPLPMTETARANKLTYSQLIEKLTPLRDKMLAHRNLRKAPFMDNKQVTEWNAMAVTALARAGLLLGEADYITAAEKCTESLWHQAWNEKTGLSRIMVENQPSVSAGLSDHAQLIQAMLTLFDATEKPLWLTRTHTLFTVMKEKFADEENGAFYNSAVDPRGPLPIRSKTAMDNVSASGNSAALSAMVMLQQRDGSPPLEKQINRQISVFADTINRSPINMSAMLSAISELHHPVPGPIVYGGAGKIRVKTWLADNSNTLIVSMNIAEGWHINSNTPQQEELFATKLEPVGQARPNMMINYPNPTILAQSFQPQLLSIYSDQVELQATLANIPKTGRMVFRLTLQLCSEDNCLPPEQLLLTPIPPAQLP